MQNRVVARRITVALARPLVEAQPYDVAIAIDVLWATTTLAVLFERGCRGVWVASDADAARAAGRAANRLICGEEGGLPPPGFDHGNSPVEFARLDLSGREVVFATTNGTGTLRACAAARRVFAGSFVNLTAAVRAAARALDEPGDSSGRLLIACAGTHGRFGLEDAACAGMMVSVLVRENPDVALDDAAEAARRLYESYGGAFEAVRASRHARTLVELGLAEDVQFCAQVDVTHVVPELHPESRWPLHLVDDPAPEERLPG